MIGEFLIHLSVGIPGLVIGWLVWRKGKITLLRSSYYRFVKDEDKKAYTAGFGKGTFVFGAGCILAGLVNLFTDSGFGWNLFALGFVVGGAMIIFVQRNYNSRF